MKETKDFSRRSIEKLPDNKPVLYKIRTPSGKTNYIGVAKKGRVRDRLKEHLPGGKDRIPGSKVQIEQMSTIQQAKRKESRVIAQLKPKYNRQ
jgi:excinuclease UvrABC nuclease subunit